MKTNSFLDVPVVLLCLLAFTACGPDVPAIKPVVDMTPVGKSIEFLGKCAVLMTLLIGGFKWFGRKP